MKLRPFAHRHAMLPASLVLALTAACGAPPADEAKVSVGGMDSADPQRDGSVGVAPPAFDAAMAAMDGQVGPEGVPDSGLSAFPPLPRPSAEPTPIDAGQPTLPDGALPPTRDGIGCFGGGQRRALGEALNGDCQDPLVVDLSDAAFGDVLLVDLPRSVRDLPIGPQDKCGLQTGRDVVLRLLLPPDADLEVAISGDDGPPVLRVFEGESNPCGAETPLICMDEPDDALCTYLRVRSVGLVDPERLTLVVSEQVDSGVPLTLALRVQDPRTGS